MPRDASDKSTTAARKGATAAPKKPLVRLPKVKRSNGKRAAQSVDAAELKRQEEARKNEALMFREAITDVMDRLKQLANDTDQ